MTVFDTAIASLFADDNFSKMGAWRKYGEEDFRPLRIMRVQPQNIFDIGNTKLTQETVLFDVLAHEAASICEGDEIRMDEQIHRVQAPPTLMLDGKILRLDVVAI
jgi:hypothetical protein